VAEREVMRVESDDGEDDDRDRGVGEREPVGPIGSPGSRCWCLFWGRPQRAASEMEAEKGC